MSIILLLAFVGILYLMEHRRREGRAVAAGSAPGRTPMQEAAKRLSERQYDRRAGLDRRHAERRHIA